MQKFKTEKELVDWIETMHLQNTNGRETPDEMFRLGIEAAIEELSVLNFLDVQLAICEECGEKLPEGNVTNICTKCFYKNRYKYD